MLLWVCVEAIPVRVARDVLGADAAAVELAERAHVVLARGQLLEKRRRAALRLPERRAVGGAVQAHAARVEDLGAVGGGQPIAVAENLQPVWLKARQHRRAARNAHGIRAVGPDKVDSRCRKRPKVGQLDLAVHCRLRVEQPAVEAVDDEQQDIGRCRCKNQQVGGWVSHRASPLLAPYWYLLVPPSQSYQGQGVPHHIFAFRGAATPGSMPTSRRSPPLGVARPGITLSDDNI
jgi:hypothetical protein